MKGSNKCSILWRLQVPSQKAIWHFGLLDWSQEPFSVESGGKNLWLVVADLESAGENCRSAWDNFESAVGDLSDLVSAMGDLGLVSAEGRRGEDPTIRLPWVNIMIGRVNSFIAITYVTAYEVTLYGRIRNDQNFAMLAMERLRRLSSVQIVFKLMTTKTTETMFISPCSHNFPSIPRCLVSWWHNG